MASVLLFARMLLLRRARVPVVLLPPALREPEPDPLEPAVLCDITIENDRIVSVGRANATSGGQDLDGALVFPGFVDAHVHLDKTHTWHRAPNRSGTFMDALETLARDRVHWTEADIKRRAGFALRTAWAQGTRIIRTHVDSSSPWGEVSHATLAELRSAWLGRIEIQTVSLCGIDDLRLPAGEEIADRAVRHGASALGGFLQMSADLPRLLDRLLAMAGERGVGVDLHVDENGSAESECLRLVAEAVLRVQFPLPVVCGHCCSLAMQSPDRIRSTIDVVREAGISIVSLPLCNLYLQDRRATTDDTRGTFPRAPLWRGLAPLRDLMAAGVKVACASDNVRDAFYAYGDYDMLEVYVQSVRLAHLDAGLTESVRVITSHAADIVGRPENGCIAPGASARLVVTEAQRFSELLSRGRAARRCVDGEELHAPALPDFAELEAEARPTKRVASFLL